MDKKHGNAVRIKKNSVIVQNILDFFRGETVFYQPFGQGMKFISFGGVLGKGGGNNM
ncbi:MAG TPA: hypothetical protein VJ943_12640 [Desulfotignum sp.]|nr:hypothetical protein [Desulfotignum sp.]